MRRPQPLCGNRAQQREMRARVGMRVHHRADEGAQPALPLAIGAQRLVAGDVLGRAGAVRDGVAVAARRAGAFAVFAAVRISRARGGACRAFGNIIVPRKTERDTGGRGQGAKRASRSLAQRAVFEPDDAARRRALPGADARLRLRKNAGRLRRRQSTLTHTSADGRSRRSIVHVRDVGIEKGRFKRGTENYF